jgi:hypothetical protein
MSLFDQLGGMLQQYAGSKVPTNSPQALDHLDQVARQASPSVLSSVLTQVFQSPQTGSFGQNISDLFRQSNPQQRAGILNQLIPSLGAGGLGSLGGLLSSGLGSNSATAPEVSPEIAQQVSPQDVEQMANRAQQQNPSVVEQAGSFYAQHPTLVKALGVGAAVFALQHIAASQQR